MRILNYISILGCFCFLGITVNAQSPTTADVSFQHPILQEARITAPFGIRPDPFTKSPEWHGGIDLGANWDAEIFAPARGEVLFAGPKPGYGKMVDLKVSNDWVLRFAHLRSINVEQGDILEPGNVLGQVGSFGRSTGPHLHLEARSDGKQYNPRDLVKLQLYAVERHRGN